MCALLTGSDLGAFLNSNGHSNNCITQNEENGDGSGRQAIRASTVHADLLDRADPDHLRGGVVVSIDFDRARHQFLGDLIHAFAGLGHDCRQFAFGELIVQSIGAENEHIAGLHSGVHPGAGGLRGPRSAGRDAGADDRDADHRCSTEPDKKAFCWRTIDCLNGRRIHRAADLLPFLGKCPGQSGRQVTYG